MTTRDDTQADVQIDKDRDSAEPELGELIRDRPEVRDVSLHRAHGRTIILVTFDGWTIPTGFGADYGMHLVSADLIDPRPGWKRLLGIGYPARLSGHFVREER